MSGLTRTCGLGFKIILWILIYVCNFTNFGDVSNLLEVECTAFNDVERGLIAYSKEQLVHWGQPSHAKVRLNGWTCLRIRRLGISNKYRFRGCRAGKRVRSRRERNMVNHDNLVNIRLVKNSIILKSLAKDHIHIGLVNVRSVKNKDTLLADYLTYHNMDAVIITESWLKETEEDKVWLDQNGLMHSGYKLVLAPRQGQKKGGGLLLAIKSNYHCKVIKQVDRNF